MLERLAVPERQVLIWTEPLRPEYFAIGAFPIFNMEADEGRFYGFPVYGVPGSSSASIITAAADRPRPGGPRIPS